jgi:AcrR family transcriptional regulator
MPNQYRQEQKQLSQESLQLALFALMRQQTFQSITISALAAKAGISRMAFYRNYPSKEAVLKDYFDAYIQPFYQFLAQLPDKQATFISQAYFQYVDEHSDLFEVLLKSGAEPILNQRFTYFVTQFYRDFVQSRPFTGAYAHYYTQFVAAGLYQITLDWIKAGKQTPRQLLAQIAAQLAG